MNKKAIVTGATCGIGREIATRLAGESVDIFLVAGNNEKLQELADELSQQGVRTLPLAMDLEQEDAPQEISRQNISAFGGIDILINNAGMPYKAPIIESDAALWNKMVAINVRAPYFLCQQAILHLKKSESPVIINIGSVVGHKGYISFPGNTDLFGHKSSFTHFSFEIDHIVLMDFFSEIAYVQKKAVAGFEVLYKAEAFRLVEKGDPSFPDLVRWR